ncbi:hypothetical protein [Sporosarcina jiandibaonis]|uniref:hypothetical protein n=1 Tax=Sporosarcina jiandibaonis TaxID=2715535 RepID=UPI0015582756|nr:hypothetical protein [Sporosarcina jiandibaonis]
MNWLLIIVIAIVVELIVRYFTRGMEDKRKREKMLSLLWVAFGVILIFVWFFMK